MAAGRAGGVGCIAQPRLQRFVQGDSWWAGDKEINVRHRA